MIFCTADMCSRFTFARCLLAITPSFQPPQIINVAAAVIVTTPRNRAQIAPSAQQRDWLESRFTDRMKSASSLNSMRIYGEGDLLTISM